MPFDGLLHVLTRMVGAQIYKAMGHPSLPKGLKESERSSVPSLLISML